MVPQLPPELWVCIFKHATYVPYALVPDIYAYASLVGSNYAKKPLRDALGTKRALVRVCKQWWHLAIPMLYISVYIGRVRSVISLSNTLARSAARRSTLVSTQPLGEYTQRLDIAMRDHCQDALNEINSLVAIITCMPRLAVVSFASSSYFTGIDFPPAILDALKPSATSLRVLDWSASQPGPCFSRMAGLLDKCTQLCILHCPPLLLFKECEHGGIPPTVTTLRLRILIPPFHPGPSALQELILDADVHAHCHKDLIRVYSPQLVSVQFHVPRCKTMPATRHMRLLAKSCPVLRSITFIWDPNCNFDLFFRYFPAITYLGLRATRSQSPKAALRMLFVFLYRLRFMVPSLVVVQFLNDKHVQCLLKAHTKLVVHELRPFMDDGSFRVEDREGVLLTDRLKALGHM